MIKTGQGIKSSPDKISTKKIKDIRREVWNARNNSSDESQKPFWEAVVYGIDLVLGTEKMDPNRFVI